jgi:surface protein
MARQFLILISIILFGTGIGADAQTPVPIWTSNGANKIQQLVESGTTDLITSGTITPWGLAIDATSDKLYWSNVTEGTINRADIDGTNIQTIVSGLDLPRGIALDETTNTLFWAEGGAENPGIKRVNLDENPLVVTDIVTSGVVSPYHIALDTNGQYVYWVDNASTVKEIKRIKYDGSAIETIITDTHVKQVAGIALNDANTTLYWSDFEDDVIYSADTAAEDQNVQALFTISGKSTPWAIDVDQRSEFLYWTDYLNSTIHQINLNTSEQVVIASDVSTASGFIAYSDLTITPGNSENFVTIWQTSNTGQSEDDEITIPTHPGSAYNYDVYWEDVNDPDINGAIANNTGNLTIDFDVPGTYRVEISGIFPRMLFFDPDAAEGNQAIDPLKILTIEQWGAIEWTSMTHAFHGAENLRLAAGDAPNLLSVDDLSFMFFGARSFKLEGDGTLNNWDVSTITSFNEMFSGATEFNGDISDWETVGAGQMNGMFYNNFAFNSDLSGWDVSNVTSMTAMFFNNRAFSADLSGWEVGNVTNMEELFRGTDTFNSDISGWDVGSVTHMNDMFQNALIFDQDLSGWDVSGVQTFEGMFFNADAFNSDISGWPTSSATSMNTMFLNAATFDQNLGGWDISDVTGMENMLDNSGLSVENYDKTLIGWESQTVQPNIRLDASGLQYCRGDGATARQVLIDEDMWSITDSGPADDCIPTNLESDEDLPMNVSLKQNYPNPFNPTTLINFDLPEAGQVRIVIYDLMGRAVHTLVDKGFSAGRHQVSFDASQLSSGVYLYRLDTPGATATRKMMLVK